MAVCTQCGGAGGWNGAYQSCYRCGGSGHGGHTDTPCMSCGGSGQSSQQDWDQCYICHGSGTVADPKPATTRQSATRSKASAKKGQPARKSKPDKASSDERGILDVIVFAVTFFFALGWLGNNTEIEGLALWIVAAIPAAMVTAIWKTLLWLIVIIVAGFVLLQAFG